MMLPNSWKKGGTAVISCLSAALGGAIGSAARYLIGLIKVNDSAFFPYKTLAINIIGSFLIGIIASLAAKNAKLDPNMVIFLKVGICGGFTTFSTFALETTSLFQSGRVWAAVLYILLSVTGCIAGVWLGGIIASRVK